MKTSTAKIKVKTAAKPIPAAMPKGICNIPRAILFHLQLARVFIRQDNGNQPLRSPVTGSMRSPSVTYAARRCSTRCVNPLTPHLTARSLCLRSQECLNPIVQIIRQIPYRGLKSGNIKCAVTPSTARGTKERK
jgi:hypothetical protein